MMALTLASFTEPKPFALTAERMTESALQRRPNSPLALRATLAPCAILSLLIPHLIVAQTNGALALTNATVIDGTGAAQGG